MGILETEIEIPAEHERNVFGQFDVFAKKIERTLHVTLIARDGKVKILGDERNVERAERTLTQLTELSRRGNVIQEQNVDYTLSLTMDDSTESVLEIDKDLICYTLQGKPIKPKTLGQKKYVDAIREDMITFGSAVSRACKNAMVVVDMPFILRWQWQSPHLSRMKWAGSF